MSVEAPKPVEETPSVDPTKAVPEQPEASAVALADPAAPATEPATEPTPAAAAPEEPAAATTTTTTEEADKDEPAVKGVPASEGVLGYKEPTLLKRFFFTKHFFWFSDEPSTVESLSTFLRSDKDDAKHASAAWARETGKGLLFFSKRAEDKASPAGIINLADASNVTKEGFDQFSFKAGNHHHRFEATKPEERDSWVVAVEKAIDEAKALKEDIAGRETYKKNVKEYSKPAVIAPATTTRSKSKEPKKSLDAGATTAAASAPAAENASTSASSAEEPKKEPKDRSQSRKRGSIFGSLVGKKEEHADKKGEKAEAKKDVKEEKKSEAEATKEEAKATEEPSTAAEASETAAVAAVPAAATSTDKKEDKEEASPVEKKNKRGSVFGTLFKKSVTSPTAEKTEKEATGATDVPPVSETAPKIEEPIENKPIDTAAVTAPVDTVQTPSAEEAVKDPAATSAAEPSAHKAEKKGGLLSFIKKTESKLEGKKEHKDEAKEDAKEDKAAEAIAKDPVAAASTEPTTESATAEPAAEASATKEERPARDNKRRTSLFFNKKRETSDAEDGAEEPKREKSPTPAKFIGNLVRRASKAVKSEGPKEKEKPSEPAATTETATTEPTTEAPATAPEGEKSQIKGDVVPSDLVTDKAEPAVPAAAPEVKATA